MAQSKNKNKGFLKIYNIIKKLKILFQKTNHID